MSLTRYVIATALCRRVRVHAGIASTSLRISYGSASTADGYIITSHVCGGARDGKGGMRSPSALLK